jgi:hypothetical protein
LSIGSRNRRQPQLDQDAILNPSTTPWQSLVPAALAWRKNYGMD